MREQLSGTASEYSCSSRTTINSFPTLPSKDFESHRNSNTNHSEGPDRRDIAFDKNHSDIGSLPKSSPPVESPIPLLVVDENGQLRNAFCKVAENLGFEVDQVDCPAAARDILKWKRIAVLLLDVTPETGGRSLLDEVRLRYPETIIIAMSFGATIAAVVETMRIGALDYLSKPFPPHMLTNSLECAARRYHFDIERRKLQESLPSEAQMGDILGKSEGMERLYKILSRVADSGHPVMILGEDGTGKPLVAKAIHANGPHAAKPFVSLDCKTLGPALLEIALFGCAKGAFGDMGSKKPGLLASSEGGTLFLDEIGDMPLDLQGKLVKAFMERKIPAIGGTKTMPITMRILAATGYDLTQMMKEGRFRLDLFGFLSVVNLRIPPLRDRLDDIAFLAKRFLEKMHQETGIRRTLPDETLRLLQTYNWPNNVIELEQSITRACSQSSGTELQTIHLPQNLLDFHRKKESVLTRTLSPQGAVKSAPVVVSIVPIAKIEERAILEAIQHTGGDKLKAAKMLGIGKTTLYRKLKEYGLTDTLKPEVAGAPSYADSASCGVNIKAVNRA
jgi:two-component system response regulator HydG